MKFPKEEEVAEVPRSNHSHSLQNKIIYAVTAVTTIYFIVIDILVYLHIQNRSVRTKDPKPDNGDYEYFRGLSTKALMEDPFVAHCKPNMRIFCSVHEH